jgi:TatA/E family protein of Tat protein translocase
MELLLIIVLALIVFGPAKLPEIMGQVGKAVNDFRRATSDLSEEFNKTIQAELQETKSVMDEAKAVMTDARTAVTDVHASVNSAVTNLPAPARVAEPALANGTNGTSTNGTSAAASTISAAEEEPKPPIADTAQWSWDTAAPAEPKPAEDTVTSAAADTVDVARVEPAEVSKAEDPASKLQDDVEVTAPVDKPKLPARDDLAPPY